MQLKELILINNFRYAIKGVDPHKQFHVRNYGVDPHKQFQVRN